MTKSIDGVLFDLDGTLLHTAGDIEQAFKKSLPDECLFEQFSQRELRQASAYGTPKFYELAKSKGIDLPPFDAFRTTLLEHYHKRTRIEAVLFDGVTTVLEALNMQHIPWGIVTNKQEASAKQDIAHFSELADCRCLIGYDTASYPKPAPEPVIMACEQLQLRPGRTLFVGDSITDMEAAKHAGLIAVGVTYGYGDMSNLGDFTPQHLIHRPSELVNIINQELA